MSYDRYGHHDIYEKGVDQNKENPLIQYHFRENDGWTMKKHGMDKHVVFQLRNDVTCEKLEKILATAPMDTDLEPILKDMIKTNTIVLSGCYKVSEN